jgi:HAD superfamily hydrolase (TIGR01450 family)
LADLDLSNKKLFLFDLDGVFYKGKEKRVKLGGTRIVGELRKRGKKLFILTNNSTDSVEAIHSNLVALGIPVAKEEILTSGLLTAEYLLTRFGKVAYYLVGEEGLDMELRKLGHRPASRGRADVVVVGLDRFVNYEKLNTASRLAASGIPIIASHNSPVYMSRDGPAIGAGPLVRAIEYGSGRRATVIGKPSPLMFRIALRKAGCSPEEAVMIGDQIDTDIRGAERVGIDSVLVLTGVDRDVSRTRALGTIATVDKLVKYL